MNDEQQPQASAPLLDDSAIKQAAERIRLGVDPEAVCKLIRDAYENACAAEMQALRAELAAAQAQLQGAWVPVPDGRYDAQHFHHKITIDRDYLKLSVPGLDGGPHEEVEVGLPEGWRLCRAVAAPVAEDTPAQGTQLTLTLPAQIWETIIGALLKERSCVDMLMGDLREGTATSERYESDVAAYTDALDALKVLDTPLDELRQRPDATAGGA